MAEYYRFLVADDSPTICAIISRFLLNWYPQANIRTAQSGQDAFHQFRVSGADLIITDVLMPDMDGIELVNALRAESSVPVIVMSGGAMLSEELTRLPAIFRIDKPFTQDILSSTVAQALLQSETKT